MKTLKTLLLATAMVLPASTLVAQAAPEHLVIIERYGYYPAKIYVQVGDTITFRNESQNWVRLYSDDPYDNKADYDPAAPCGFFIDAGGNNQGVQFEGDKDGFAQGWFSVGSERTIEVTECIETRMYAPEVYNAGGTDWNARFDLIVFGEAPNGS